MYVSSVFKGQGDEVGKGQSKLEKDEEIIPSLNLNRSLILL